MVFHPKRWDYASRTGSSVSAFDIGLVSRSTAPRIPVPSVMPQQTNSVTIKWVAVVMVTGFTATTRSGTSSTQLPSLLLWLPLVRPLVHGVVPDSLSRPADIFLPTWRHGRSAALDVHIISPLQQSTVNAAAFNPGHALEVGVRRKLNAHLNACRSSGVHFLPIVAEALGGLGQDTVQLVRSLGKSIAQQAFCQEATTPTSQLFHRLAIKF